eukprot:1150971-Pelagomonas_calceolata.AAC.1
MKWKKHVYRLGLKFDAATNIVCKFSIWFARLQLQGYHPTVDRMQARRFPRKPMQAKAQGKAVQKDHHK